MSQQPARPLMSRAWSGSSMLAGLGFLDLRAVKHELPDDMGALQDLVQALLGHPNQPLRNCLASRLKKTV